MAGNAAPTAWDGSASAPTAHDQSTRPEPATHDSGLGLHSTTTLSRGTRPRRDSGLGLHVDDADLSFNLLLTDETAFEGGGTWCEPEPRLDTPSTSARLMLDPTSHLSAHLPIHLFSHLSSHLPSRLSPHLPSRLRFEQLGLSVKPRAGEMLSHHGKLPHAGYPITAGGRYVLVGFVSIEQGR